MNATNETKNRARITTGQLKEASGKATRNRRLQAAGAAVQVTGELKQAGAKAKDAVRSMTR